jgi:hypothetical protein
MVPADSGRVSRARPYLGTGEEDRTRAYGTLTRCGALFQRTSARLDPFLVIPAPQPRAVSRPVWAFPRSLAATEGVSVDFRSSGY